MEPSEFRIFMHEASSRLLNFDPNFSASAAIYDPLPAPWETCQSKDFTYTGGWVGSAAEFREPAPPSLSHHRQAPARFYDGMREMPY